MRFWLFFVIIVMVCPFFAGCSSINRAVEKTGQLIDGTLFAYKTETSWRPLSGEGLQVRAVIEKDGTKKIVFNTSELPYLTFYALPPNEQGVFYVTSVHFLAGNYGGWNEFDSEVTGQGRLRFFKDGNAAFTIINVERGPIYAGKIRRESTRLTGSRALEALQNRDERLRYLTSWMRDFKEVPLFASQKKFETFWKPKLLPSNKRERNAAPALPDELLYLRESGALEADWDEAAPWIYLDYDWEKATSVLKREIILTTAK